MPGTADMSLQRITILACSVSEIIIIIFFLPRGFNKKGYCKWNPGWKTTSALGLCACNQKPSRIRMTTIQPTHELKPNCVMLVSHLVISSGRPTWQRRDFKLTDRKL